MRNISYKLLNQLQNLEPESGFPQIHRTLDSLGNNLMGMLWLMNLALAALQEEANLDQAKKNLQEALRAGNCAKDLMRLIINASSQLPQNLKSFNIQDVAF